MTADDVLQLLEANWESLRVELGERWAQFAERYGSIVGFLPANPTPYQLEDAVDALCELLAQSDEGRRLLTRLRKAGSERLIADSSETLRDVEHVRQICNRLMDLGGKSHSGGSKTEVRTHPVKTKAE
jgi:hypothetical protein